MAANVLNSFIPLLTTFLFCWAPCTAHTNYDDNKLGHSIDIEKFASSVAFKNRLNGGTPALPGELPYWVGLINAPTQRCAGAIISDKHILTAASCWNVPTMDIIAGCVDRTSPDCVTYQLQSVLIHPNYNPNTLEYDVAVITIVGEFVFNEFVQIINVSQETAVDISTPAIAMGWSASITDLLRMDVSVVDCGGMGNYICTSPQGLSFGDMGSPLVSDGVIIGISSGMSSTSIMDANTKIGSYYDWINSIISK